MSESSESDGENKLMERPKAEGSLKPLPQTSGGYLGSKRGTTDS